MSGIIKQISCGRRKADMTRKEYFDYRWQVHGKISDEPTTRTDKPAKYIQTQIFDSVFPMRKEGPLNANQAWSGRDDVTELYYDDMAHLASVFASEHIRTKVGPDGINFYDIETSISLLAQEKEVPLQTELAKTVATRQNQHDNMVAMWFLSTPHNESQGAAVEEKWTPILTEELNKLATNDAARLIVNTGIVSDQFNLTDYFGGAGMPRYAVVYKIELKCASSVAAIRRAQAAAATRMGTSVDLGESFTVYGKEGLVLDIDGGVKFDPARQPVFHDLV